MKRFKRVAIIQDNMISSKNFKITKKNNNKKITINFNACSFTDNKICFFIFRNKLNTKLKININKLFSGYFELLEHFNKNQIINPIKIYKDLEELFIDFDKLETDDQVKKLTELLDYILMNRSYFIESKYTMDALEKKIVKLYYCNKDFKLLKYYYFLIYKVNYIKIENIEKKTFKYVYDDDVNSKYSEEIDFELDNQNYKINWAEINHDLNFY